MSEMAIRALEQKILEQDRALQANLIERRKRPQKNITIKMNRYNFQKNQNAEQEYMVWKCMSWNIRGW